MRLLIPIKRVIDYAVKIRIKSNKLGVEKNNVRMSLNPFCELAIEEGIRWKEKELATEIVAVSIGPKKTQEVLRTAMAMGVDRCIHVLTELETDIHLQPLTVAKLLQKIVEKESPNAIIMGKQSIDDDSNQVGQMLSALLDWSQATFCSKISLLDEKTAEVLREIDGGTEKISVSLPSIFTADLRLNEPRYATIPNIMKARRKKIEQINATTLKVDLTPRLQILELNNPPKRSKGKIVDVEELINCLKTELKLI